MMTATQTFKPKAVRPTRYCASCRRGENKVEADHFIKGTRVTGDGRKVPYRGYLCEDHLEIMVEDGDLLDNFEVVQSTSEKARLEHAQHLTEVLTGFESFAALCRNNPTLNAAPDAGYTSRWMFARLREYFREATGRQAAR